MDKLAKFFWFVILLAVVILVSSCAPVVPATVSPATTVAPATVSPVTSTVTASVEAPGETETPVNPAASETPAPDLNTPTEPSTIDSELVICGFYACGGIPIAWKFVDGQPEPVEWAVEFGMGYDVSKQGSVLFGTRFPDFGAGPGNVSVTDLKMIGLADSQAQTLVAEERVVRAIWAPDGESFLYVLATDSTYELHHRTLSGEDRILAKDTSFSISFSPSGQQAAFTRESGYNLDVEPGLYLVDLQSGVETKISSVNRAGAGSMTDSPIWSPDGSAIIMSYNKQAVGDVMVRAYTDGSGDAEIGVTPELERTFTENDMNSYFLWTDDNRLVADLMPGMASVDPARLVVVELNPDLTEIVAFETAYEGEEMLVGWAKENESVWLRGIEYRLIEVPLP